MKIKDVKTIDKDIVSVEISVSELGTSTLDAAEEKNQLENFIKSIEYKKINFVGNMKLESNVPVVTTDPVDDTSVVEISIPNLINKKIEINEDMKIELSVDTTKIADSELNAVFNTKEMLGQARITLFTEKIKEAISEKLLEIRNLANTFEGETETIL